MNPFADPNRRGGGLGNRPMANRRSKQAESRLEQQAKRKHGIKMKVLASLHAPSPGNSTPPSATTPAERPSLLTYLLQAHKKYEYLLDDRVKKEIIAECNEYFFSSDAAFLNLVNASGQSNKQTSAIPYIYRDTDDMYHSDHDGNGSTDEEAIGIEYSESRRGKPCGHVFFRGEGVYRCRNCSLDDTCVLCSRCFHASDHTGHDTSFSVNSGTGGCCDCGDSEAWKVPIECKYHSMRFQKRVPETKQIPDHILPGMKETIRTVLEFMLGVFCMAKEHFDFEFDEAKIRADMESTNIAFDEHDIPPVYSTVLWNDDTHSFQEVIDQLVDCIKVPPHRARDITNNTHSQGREVIYTSPDLPQQIRLARHMASIRLQMSIRSARDTFREQLCAVLLSWLKDLSKVYSEKYKSLNMAYDGNFNSVVKSIICKELTSPWQNIETNDRLRQYLDDNEPMSDSETYDASDLVVEFDEYEASLESESMTPTQSEERRFHVQLPPLTPINEDGPAMTPTTMTPSISAEGGGAIGDADTGAGMAPLQPPPFSRRRSMQLGQIPPTPPASKNKLQHRLDWFLLYDMRLWHEVRAGLRELYMATLTLSMEYKKRIAVSFATNYKRLSSSFLILDKGPEHSIILFSVQLFTVPTIAYTLAYEHKFLYTILEILTRFFTKSTEPELLRRGIIRCDSPAFRNRRYFHVFHDMRYITGTDMCTNAISGDVTFLTVYMRFLCLFQGMDPMRRQKGNHIEYEADTWINAFNVTLQLAKSCRQLAVCYFKDPINLTHAVRATLRMIHLFSQKLGEEMGGVSCTIPNSENEACMTNEIRFRSLTTQWGRSYSVLQYSVSDNYVSFHHPLHWFLAQLLHCLDKLDTASLAAAGWYSFQELVWTFGRAQWEDGNPYRDQAEMHDMGPMLRQDEAMQRRLLAVFDYPIRVCCMMAQIRSYLWVRNGHIAKSSAAHYCEITLRYNTYDLDVFLIQVAFTLFDPDHILLTLLDRYELLDFFHGRTKPAPNASYDATQQLHMVEQFLNLLIVCMSERSIVAGLSLEEQTRRFIVHGTITQVPYTDLMRLIPDRMTELTSFDHIIKDVANFRGPASTNDIGCYQLKDEFLHEVDPYFIHYSRNRKAEAEQRLRQYAQATQTHQTHQDPKSIFAHTPLLDITTGPYVYLGNMLHGPLACQVIFYAIYHGVHSVGNSVYDTIVDNAIHLLYLAVKDRNNYYVPQATGASLPAALPLGVDAHELSGFWSHVSSLIFQVATPQGEREQLNLLTLILRVMPRSECLHWAGKLDYIVDQLSKYGSEQTKTQIRESRVAQGKQSTQTKSQAEAEASQATEKRRQVARERKRQMMDRFMSAQKKFIEKHTDLYDDLEAEGEDSSGDRGTSANSSFIRPGSAASGSGYTSRAHLEDKNMAVDSQEAAADGKGPTGNSVVSTRPASSASSHSRSVRSSVRSSARQSQVFQAGTSLSQLAVDSMANVLGDGPALGSLGICTADGDDSFLESVLEEDRDSLAMRDDMEPGEDDGSDGDEELDQSHEQEVGEEDDDMLMEDHPMKPTPLPRVGWEAPGGSCIVCQENLDTGSIYGMVALIQRSKHVRKLPTGHRRFMLDLLQSPDALDTEQLRPSALAVRGVETAFTSLPQDVKGFDVRGFPSSQMVPGMYVSSCGHLMHLHCFDTFYATVETRHKNQPTRNSPENTQRREFMCPFCKALGNTLIPALHSIPQLPIMVELFFTPPKPNSFWLDSLLDSSAPAADPPVASQDTRRQHADQAFAGVARWAHQNLLGALIDLRLGLSTVRSKQIYDRGPHSTGGYTAADDLVARTDRAHYYHGSTGASPFSHDAHLAHHGTGVVGHGYHVGNEAGAAASGGRDCPEYVTNTHLPLALAVMTQTAPWSDPIAESGAPLRDALTRMVYRNMASSPYNTSQLASWDHVLNSLAFGPTSQPHSAFQSTPPTHHPLPITPELAGLQAKGPENAEDWEVEMDHARHFADLAHKTAQDLLRYLEEFNIFTPYTDDVKVLYFRLADVLNIHMGNFSPSMKGEQYDKLLIDMLYYTITTVEATSRGVAHGGTATGTVLDALNETTFTTLHMMSDLILHYYNLMRLTKPRQDWLKRQVRQRGSLWLTKLLQPHLLYVSTAPNDTESSDATMAAPTTGHGGRASSSSALSSAHRLRSTFPSGPLSVGHATYQPRPFPVDYGLHRPVPYGSGYHTGASPLGGNGPGSGSHHSEPGLDLPSNAIPEGLFATTAKATQGLLTTGLIHSHPLLLEDPFQVLTDLSMFVVPEYSLDVMPLVNLLFTAELVRVILGLVESAVRPDKPIGKSWLGQDFIRQPDTLRSIIASYRAFNPFGLAPGTGANTTPAADGKEEEEEESYLDHTTPDTDGLVQFTSWLLTVMEFSVQEIREFHEQVPAVVLAKLVRTLCLPFLRKAVILLHTHFGVAFDNAYPLIIPNQMAVSTDPLNDTSISEGGLAREWAQYAEVDRLLYLLNIPPFAELCRIPEAIAQPMGGHGLEAALHQPRSYVFGLIVEWCNHLKAVVPFVRHQVETMDMTLNGHPSGPHAATRFHPSHRGPNASSVAGRLVTRPVSLLAAGKAPADVVGDGGEQSTPPGVVKLPPIPMVWPAVMELTTLPTRFDFLFEKSNQVVCTNCNKVPSDPALCMFCGKFMCVQSFCCSHGYYGECNLHTMECGGPIGIFLLVKKNTALLLWNDNGTFIVTPYRDYHGEMDLGLKRGRPLFLDQKRFDELRRTWLTHQVPNLIARTLENVFDTGGWVTL
ncbi:E3 ubiquitin-protein ligase ubr1 [Dimargaris verticillata]|uniref:E3 ubiquitin-protein ligase n=1 Tax=Dimargaris verticillata TaxID=2761393 RepID=A0A9W8B7H9_9FUNG|nr:E3 ubiquitin-protein ligase ubr1 [Dimargaris verticillata]